MKPKVKTIDKVIQERQWKKWLFNERDEKHERKRESGRYRIEGGKLVRLPRKAVVDDKWNPAEGKLYVEMDRPKPVDLMDYPEGRARIDEGKSP